MPSPVTVYPLGLVHSWEVKEAKAIALLTSMYFSPSAVGMLPMNRNCRILKKVAILVRSGKYQ